MWNEFAFSILFLRNQPKNDHLKWKEKCLNYITQNLISGLCTVLFWFPWHLAYISCFFRLPLGVSNTVELGLPLNTGFAERDPSFSLFACLLPINVMRSYVCLFRRQWVPFIVIQPMHKILHLTPSSHLNYPLQVNLLGSMYQVPPNSSFYQAWLIENEIALSVYSLLS